MPSKQFEMPEAMTRSELYMAVSTGFNLSSSSTVQISQILDSLDGTNPASFVLSVQDEESPPSIYEKDLSALFKDAPGIVLGIGEFSRLHRGQSDLCDGAPSPDECC